MLAAHERTEGTELLGGAESPGWHSFGTLFAYLLDVLLSLFSNLLEVAAQTVSVERTG
jgi:hypothetical protein